MAREMAHAVDPRPRLSEPPPHYVRPERVSSLVGSGDTESLVAHPRTVDECRDVLDYCQRQGLSVCPRGSGHSYGDQALNDQQLLLDTTRMDRILDFDSETGRMVCEPGVQIIDVYRRAHPQLFMRLKRRPPTLQPALFSSAVDALLHFADRAEILIQPLPVGGADRATETLRFLKDGIQHAAVRSAGFVAEQTVTRLLLKRFRPKMAAARPARGSADGPLSNTGLFSNPQDSKDIFSSNPLSSGRRRRNRK